MTILHITLITRERCLCIMEVTFKNKKLQQMCNAESDKKLVQEFGPKRAKKLRNRLDDLKAAPNLETMRHLPGRLHELTGTKKGQLSLDLEHPLRLLFQPSNDGVIINEAGSLIWGSVNAVQVLNVEDTHG